MYGTRWKEGSGLKDGLLVDALWELTPFLFPQPRDLFMKEGMGIQSTTIKATPHPRAAVCFQFRPETDATQRALSTEGQVLQSEEKLK